MKINQIIIKESMGGVTSGNIATVESPMGSVQTRTEVKGLHPIGSKIKKKGPYANSLSEGKMKDLSMDLRSDKDGLSDTEFKKKYGKTKEEMRKAMKEKPEPKKVDEAKKDFLGKLQKNVDKSNKQKKDTEEKVKQHQQDEKKKVEEAKLEEDDIIVVPGKLNKRKNGFVAKGQSRVDHEVEMARSDVLATMKNAKAIYELLKNRTEDEGIEGWVQEKLIKANDYLNAVKEYYDEKFMQQEMTAGVIAGGGVGEGTVNEKAVSKAQQRFMGMVHAVQKGDMKAPSKAVASAAKGMTKKAGHEFAATKHKGLPEKVKKD
jgi:hypothetical protein